MTGSSAATVPTGVEPPRTLLSPPPRVLGLGDQAGLWANLGITLTIPVAAAFVLDPAGVPPLSYAAATVAVVVGALIGSALLAAAAVPGAVTGAPAMVLLRGLLGGRLSYLPTAANLVQNVGWATVEILVIAQTAVTLTSPRWREPFVLAAGIVATLLALRPIGFVRVLRRYAVWVVLAATGWLLVQVLRHGLPHGHAGSWTGFWVAADVVIALPVSWAPLAADYSRHSTSTRATAVGTSVGYAVACAAFFILGLLALGTVAGGTDVVGALVALPLGGLAVALLAVDEVDKAFANIYSTAASAQNVQPRADRRRLAVAVGALATGLALAVDLQQYESFLFLIGSVFVPLYGAFLTDWFVLGGRHRWDLAAGAPARPVMLAPWLAGFVAYQLVNPGSVGWWAAAWGRLAGAVGFAPQPWMSASLVAFVVAGVVTVVLAPVDRRCRLGRPTAVAG